MHSLSASDLTDYHTMHMSPVTGADMRREEQRPERGLKSHAVCTQCRMNSACRSLQQHANMFTRQVLLFSQPYHLHHKWRWNLIGLVIIQISIETCSIWLLIEQNKQLGAKQHLKHVSGGFSFTKCLCIICFQSFSNGHSRVTGRLFCLVIFL